MNKNLKAMITFIVLTGTLCSGMLPTTAYAASAENLPKLNQEVANEEITDQKESKVDVSRNISITDEAQLEEFAKEHNIPLVVDGEKIKKIETEFRAFNQEDEEIIQSKAYLGTVLDHGHGWYNKDTDLYANVTTSGPDTLTISKTDTFTATMTNSFGVSAKTVSANVGFTIGASYSVTFSSSTPVKRGERLNVKAYTTHQRKSASVFESFTNKYKGVVNAYKPTGAYFVKTWY